MRAPIHSRKHYVQMSQGTVAQAAILNTNLVVAIEGAATQPTQVSEGAIVKAVWVELWLNNASTSVMGSFTMCVVKLPGGVNALTTTDMAALHDYNNKKNIYYTTQGLVAPTDAAMFMAFKGWIRIPKGKQRFGLGDALQLSIFNSNLTAVDVNFCGIIIYKEYQ